MESLIQFIVRKNIHILFVIVCVWVLIFLTFCTGSLAKTEQVEAVQKVDPRIQLHPKAGVCLMKIPAGTNIGGHITVYDGVFMCDGIFMEILQGSGMTTPQALPPRKLIDENTQ